jgi:aryl-alcohol dehydrogenase-like predicted oxidoreductase
MLSQLSSTGADLGLGLAALGRPGYMNLGHGEDLPRDKSVSSLERHCHEVLDEAYAGGVRYFDAARSYGRAEAFLASWLENQGHPDVVVGSKWGYAYTADWRVDAEVHEVKEHSLSRFEQQWRESLALLPKLGLYWVHSLDSGSPLFEDVKLQRALWDWSREHRIVLGVTVTGANQGEVVARARAIEQEGTQLFGAVQATWNVLEPSAGPALADAHGEGWFVVIKEALANGRLTPKNPSLSREAGRLVECAEELGVGPDAVALAAALEQPWCHRVLSGAATPAQVASHFGARQLHGRFDVKGVMAPEKPADYWRRRATLPWN